MTYPNIRTDGLTEAQLKVIDVAEKLFALGRNNDNEHQAAAALAKAQQLLDDNGLEVAHLGQSKTGAHGAREDNKLAGGLYGWQRDIWAAAAKSSFCHYQSIKGLERGSKYEHRLVGRKENVLVARLMAEYLQQTIERIAQEWARDMGYKSCFVREAIAHREGIATRLVERLEVMRRERLEADERKKREEAASARHPSAVPGTSLVLADVVFMEEDFNTDYLSGLEPGTTAARRAEARARQMAADEDARIRGEQRALWKNDRAAFMTKYHDNTALQAQMQQQDKVNEDYQKYLNGETTDTYGPGYKPTKARASRAYSYNPRTRAPTAREERASPSSFSSGYAKGDSVGLDGQIDHTKTKQVR
jgi:hypothetical protein